MKRNCLVSICFAIIVLISGVLATSASAEPTYVHDFSIGSGGSGKGQFNNAQAVAVDNSGNAWVADKGNHRLQKFNSKGEFLLEATQGPGFSSITPNDITIDSKGTVWALDENSNSAIEYDSDGWPHTAVGGELRGKFGESKGTLSTPEAFTVDSAGHVWFADLNGQRVVEVAPPNGEHWWSEWVSQFSIKGAGSGPGEFLEPTGMAFGPEGKLWISDSGWSKSRVQKFSSKGEFQGTVGEGYLGEAEGSPSFSLVTGSTIVWVANGCAETPSVMAFNSSSPGAPVNQFGESGSEGAAIGCAYDIAPDSNGGMWVIENSGRNLLHKWTSAPTAITEDPSGVTSGEATLKGSVNPNGLATTYQFEYGGNGYTNVSTAQSAGSGTELVKESLKVTGLSPDTIYHYRISATNAQGTTRGADKWFIPGTNEWGIQQTTEPVGSKSGSLSAVSCTSSENCMTVGSYQNSSEVYVTLAKIESAGQWAVTSTPNPSGSTGSGLYEVSCVSANDCAAVGYANIAGATTMLAEMWNGTQWSIKSPPGVKGATSNMIMGVSCVASNDCTAVGWSTASGSASTLAEHWNGSSWAVMSTPNLGGYKKSELFDVSCVSSSDCWAVGMATNFSEPEASLAEHWDGTKWTINSPAGSQNMSEISCASASSCVVTTNKNTVLSRWNGSAWSQETAPKPEGAGATRLSDISCTAASACTAVGWWVLKTAPLPLMESWNGSKWSIQSAPPPAGTLLGFAMPGVSCVSSTTCTAVGSYVPKGGSGAALVEARH